MNNDYLYPVDVGELVKALDADTAKKIHLEEAKRDDQRLTAVVWGVGHGWFPVNSRYEPHYAVDIGVLSPNGKGGMLRKPVKSIGKGKVIFLQDKMSEGRFALSRVIVEHPIPGGSVWALYQHLESISVTEGKEVKAGDQLGIIGTHGDFPHLRIATISTTLLGSPEREGRSLMPLVDSKALPADDSVWDILAVKLPTVDSLEWPKAPSGPVYAYNPIELVRFLREEPDIHDVGADHHLNRIKISHENQTVEVQDGIHADHSCTVLHSQLLSADAGLRLAATDAVRFLRMGKGSQLGAATLNAIQGALDKLEVKGKRRKSFDDEVVRRVQVFQKRIKSDPGFLEIYGFEPPQVAVDGRIDWLTLIAMDAFVAVKEQQDAAAAAAKAEEEAQKAADKEAEDQQPEDPEAAFDREAGEAYKAGYCPRCGYNFPASAQDGGAAPAASKGPDQDLPSGLTWVSFFSAPSVVEGLEPSFRSSVQDFLDALKDAGVPVIAGNVKPRPANGVKISSTFRPRERSYLMHWSWMITKKSQGFDLGGKVNNLDADDKKFWQGELASSIQSIPKLPGVTVTWWHGDLTASVKGAREMVDNYGINDLKTPPAKFSRHNERKAIDMNVWWDGTLTIKKKDGSSQTISSAPSDQTNSELIEVARTYGLIHFAAQKPEPSDAKEKKAWRAVINQDAWHFSTDGR